jgi:hypothetical protein
MSRFRTLKPGFFENEVLSSLPHRTRLLFAGMWTLADRDGRLEDRPHKIAASLFMYEGVTSAEAEEMISSLAETAFITRYSENGRWIQVNNWKKHQHPHNTERASVIPPPPNGESTVNPPKHNGESPRKGVGIRDKGVREKAKFIAPQDLVKEITHG